MPRILTVLAPGFEETEAVTFIDLLRRAKVSVVILGLESRDVAGAHDIVIRADMTLSEFTGPFDGIVLPGGMPGTKHLANSPRLLDLIREAHKRGLLCAAICAAPSVLGKAGILKGVEAACYPGFEQELAGAAVVERAVVRDKNIITSRGVGTAIPFALELVSYLSGPGAAGEVEQAILYSLPGRAA